MMGWFQRLGSPWTGSYQRTPTLLDRKYSQPTPTQAVGLDFTSDEFMESSQTRFLIDGKSART